MLHESYENHQWASHGKIFYRKPYASQGCAFHCCCSGADPQILIHKIRGHVATKKNVKPNSEVKNPIFLSPQLPIVADCCRLRQKSAQPILSILWQSLVDIP
uniref:Uncharacterized protein n=1 Tax=Romanomermis culicivorax TaxID=13658 RepID=A0A915HPW9_ROMCU